uniref:Allatostatin A receptor n=1 Tax=Grapholita molesta TaxID=192188 RepID=A0A7T3U0J2_GRAMO|nr:allatostatin A receptor [Grapholita molesta]
MDPTEDEFYSMCLNLTNEEASLGSCNFSSEYENGELLEKVVSRVVPIFFGFIGIVGLVGNALVVLVVSANPGMRSTTNLLIINLAVADLLFVIFCVPFTATDYVMPRWPFGDWWCKVVQYFIVVTAHASVYTLVLMSLDRFMAVVHPIASMSIRTEKNALLAIACIWVVILTTAIPVGICHGEREYSYYDRNHSSCVFLEEQGYSKLGFQMSFFLSSYVIPLALISFLYMCMLIRLWKSAPGGRVSAESRRGRKKVTRMVVVVVVVFAVCWCPIQIILLVKALDAYSINYFTVTAQIVSHVLAYMNSCVNPLLYAFLSENFRVAFRKVMYCPPAHNDGMCNRPQTTKTTRTGNGNSCHDIV